MTDFARLAAAACILVPFALCFAALLAYVCYVMSGRVTRDEEAGTAPRPGVQRD